jgi:hypothetical protein
MIRPPDKAVWFRLQALHLAVDKWATAKEHEGMDPGAVETAEARLLLALALLEDTAAKVQHPASMFDREFDRSWTPRDSEQYDRDEFLTAVEQYANKEAS